MVQMVVDVALDRTRIEMARLTLDLHEVRDEVKHVNLGAPIVFEAAQWGLRRL